MACHGTLCDTTNDEQCWGKYPFWLSGESMEITQPPGISLILVASPCQWPDVHISLPHWVLAHSMWMLQVLLGSLTICLTECTFMILQTWQDHWEEWRPWYFDCDWIWAICNASSSPAPPSSRVSCPFLCKSIALCSNFRGIYAFSAPIKHHM